MCFSEVCQLSRGNVLRRCFESRAEVKRFMVDGRMDALEYDDQIGSWTLHFLVDVTLELKILNLKLRGPGQLVTAAYESVKAFSTSFLPQSFHSMQISCGGGHSIQG